MDLLGNPRSLNVVQMLTSGFLAFLFLQSGFDKVVNFTSNRQYFQQYFAATPVKRVTPFLLVCITVLEIAVGFVCAFGVVLNYVYRYPLLAERGSIMAAFTIGLLFIGQRLAKDYAASAAITPYFLLSLGSILLHGIGLQGLTAPYEVHSIYQLNSGGSTTHTGPLRFVAVGDTGKGNPTQRAVGEAIGRQCAQAGCDLVLLLGDNFYPIGVTSTSDPQWQSAFVEPYASVSAPFYAVLGNHDYGPASSDGRRSAAQIAYSQVNPKWHMPASHYRFRFGDVEFFAADTTSSFFERDQDIRRNFRAWIAASKAPWKIVFGHHNYTSNGPHGVAGAYDGVPSFTPIASGRGVKSFFDDEVCGKVDVYLAGHDHILEWLKDGCGDSKAARRTELLVSGGGSSPTRVREPPQIPIHWHAAIPGFLYVVIDKDTFTGTYFDQKGTALYTRSFTRS